MKKTEAIAFLRGQGLTRQQARNLLEDAYNADVYPQAGYWRLQPDLTQKGPPICVYLAGSYHSGKDQTPSDIVSKDAASETPIFAAGQPGHGQDGTTGNNKNDEDFMTPDLGCGSTGTRPRSTSINGSVSAGENDVSIFAAAPHTPAYPQPIVPGDWVYILNHKGEQLNEMPYLCTAITPGPDGRDYALFLEIPNGFPVEQCERAHVPAPEPPGEAEEEGGV